MTELEQQTAVAWEVLAEIPAILRETKNPDMWHYIADSLRRRFPRPRLEPLTGPEPQTLVGQQVSLFSGDRP